MKGWIDPKTDPVNCWSCGRFTDKPLFMLDIGNIDRPIQGVRYMAFCPKCVKDMDNIEAKVTRKPRKKRKAKVKDDAPVEGMVKG